MDAATRAALAWQRPTPGVKLVAEKVETQADLAEARELEYDLFQGYVLSRPEVRRGHRSPSALSHRLRLMQSLGRPDPDLVVVEDLLKRDPALAFKLLRYVNSAAFGLRVQARTLHKALAYLGQAGTRAWAMIAILADLGRSQPFELIATSVVRGRFCELVGQVGELADRATDLFLLGLFSLTDAITGRPLADVVAELGGRLTVPTADLPPLYLATVDWGNLSSHLPLTSRRRRSPSGGSRRAPSPRRRPGPLRGRSSG